MSYSPPIGNFGQKARAIAIADTAPQGMGWTDFLRLLGGGSPNSGGSDPGSQVRLRKSHLIADYRTCLSNALVESLANGARPTEPIFREFLKAARAQNSDVRSLADEAAKCYINKAWRDVARESTRYDKIKVTAYGFAAAASVIGGVIMAPSMAWSLPAYSAGLVSAARAFTGYERIQAAQEIAKDKETYNKVVNRVLAAQEALRPAKATHLSFFAPEGAAA